MLDRSRWIARGGGTLHHLFLERCDDMLKVPTILLLGHQSRLMTAIRSRLESERAFAVSWINASSADVIQTATTTPVDVVVMDVDVDATGCLDAVRTLLAIQHDAHVVLLVTATSDDFVAEALQLGSVGILNKHGLTKTIVPAIHTVLAGGSCFPEEVQARLVVESSGMRLISAKRQNPSS